MSAETAGQAAGVVRVRKRPVEVEAIQWTGGNLGDVQAFTGSGDFEAIPGGDRLDREMTAHVWDKLHSTWVRLRDGDWIIKGVKGEFCPCADDVFRETYEAASTGQSAPLSQHLECKVCNGTMTLTVPDSDGEGG